MDIHGFSRVGSSPERFFSGPAYGPPYPYAPPSDGHPIQFPEPFPWHPGPLTGGHHNAQMPAAQTGPYRPPQRPIERLPRKAEPREHFQHAFELKIRGFKVEMPKGIHDMQLAELHALLGMPALMHREELSPGDALFPSKKLRMPPNNPYLAREEQNYSSFTITFEITRDLHTVIHLKETKSPQVCVSLHVLFEGEEPSRNTRQEKQLAILRPDFDPYEPSHDLRSHVEVLTVDGFVDFREFREGIPISGDSADIHREYKVELLLILLSTRELRVALGEMVVLCDHVLRRASPYRYRKSSPDRPNWLSKINYVLTDNLEQSSKEYGRIFEYLRRRMQWRIHIGLPVHLRKLDAADLLLKPIFSMAVNKLTRKAQPVPGAQPTPGMATKMGNRFIRSDKAIPVQSQEENFGRFRRWRTQGRAVQLRQNAARADIADGAKTQNGFRNRFLNGQNRVIPVQEEENKIAYRRRFWNGVDGVYNQRQAAAVAPAVEREKETRGIRKFLTPEQEKRLPVQKAEGTPSQTKRALDRFGKTSAARAAAAVPGSGEGTQSGLRNRLLDPSDRNITQQTHEGSPGPRQRVLESASGAKRRNAATPPTDGAVSKSSGRIARFRGRAAGVSKPAQTQAKEGQPGFWHRVGTSTAIEKASRAPETRGKKPGLLRNIRAELANKREPKPIPPQMGEGPLSQRAQVRKYLAGVFGQRREAANPTQPGATRPVAARTPTPPVDYSASGALPPDENDPDAILPAPRRES